MRKYNVEKVKEYINLFNKEYEYGYEFQLALLIVERLDVSIEDITENFINRLGDIYINYESIYNEVLNDELRELQEELNE